MGRRRELVLEDPFLAPDDDDKEGYPVERKNPREVSISCLDDRAYYTVYIGSCQIF